MALTGKFLADFSSFDEACKKAVVSVESIGMSAGKVGPKLDRLVEQFSGKKVVAEAALMTRAIEEIGGASMLTESEMKRVGATMQEALAKMRLSGEKIPENMQKLADATAGANKATTDWLGTITKMAGAVGIAFSAQAVVNFVGSVFDAAGAVKDLSNEWGISTKAQQQWSSAAKLSGSSAEDLGKSLGFMSRNLADGSKEYKAAVDAANSAQSKFTLSFKDLRESSPEDAFRAMVEAVGAIEDPMLQADTAVKLFGRSAAALLPAIREDFLRLADAQKFMSDDTINRLEAAGDAWEELWNRVTIVTGELVANAMKNVPILTASWSNFYTGMKLGMFGSAEAQQAWIKEQQKALGITDDAGKATKTAAEKHAAYQAAMRSTRDVLEQQRDAENAAKDALTKRKQELEATKRVQEQYAATLRKMTDDVSGGDKLDAAQKWLIVLKDTVPIQQMTADKQAMLNKVMGDALEVYQQFGEDAPQAVIDVYVATLKAVPIITDLGKALAMLPQNVAGFTLAARQTVGAIGELVAGTAQAATKVPALGTSLAGDLGKNILGAIMGGGSVFKTIGSTIGNTILDPEKSGLGAAITKQVGKLPGMLGGALSSVLPMVGSLLGPALELATKGIGKLFGRDEESKQVNPMRDKFVAAAGGLAELNRQAAAAGLTLEGMLKADTVDKYNAAIQNLQAGFEFQQQSMQVAIETAQRYGFTLEELGPALQRQELDKQAQQLYRDWQVLNAAGIDTIAISDRMGESVSAYVQQAVAMGTEVPEAMRPMLDAMAKSGQLTDANGNKIEDLEAAGVSFALTMSDGFKELIKGVEKLTDAISRGLGIAVDDTSKKIAAMPKSVDVAVVYHDPGFKTSQPVEVESYSEGSGGFRNFGSGTPVMLHGWEAVVPREPASSSGPPLLAASSGGASAAPVVINIDATGAFFDTPGDLQRLADRVNDALTAKFGLTHRMRAA